jgi:predicted lipid carrier protein YhbT
MRTDRLIVIREKKKAKERLRKHREKRYGKPKVKDMLAMEFLLEQAKQIIYN